MNQVTEVVVQPMQWKPIIDISETERFASKDATCFAEIREVLKKYGLLEKYGLALIHRHFDIDDDECLVESIDVDSRTLSVTPVKKAELETYPTTITMWRLTEGDIVAQVGCRCRVSIRGHEGDHQAF